ncbi:hypothetical protein HAX54_021159 [Datura stramonium]|uniref:Uncharacterized protein n=1 Tax=Datura stramonium TaxID=4076 RepID=A0ABS8US83_DATST|nr:hypothetical protein [Datura stramonium]
MKFCDSKTPHPRLEIESNKRDPRARVLSLEFHPSVIGVFLLDIEPPAESLHLTKWSTEKTIDILDSNIKGTNSVDTSTLEGFVKGFFETYEEYDAMKSSSSQKMTKECHQISLFDMLQHLSDAKEEKSKDNGHMEDLQAILAKVEKELKICSAKRKKTIAHIYEQKEQLSKS